MMTVNKPYKRLNTVIMLKNWIDFLQTQKLASKPFVADKSVIAPLTHLSLLTVSGKDAASFLQGQITCNVTELIDNQAELGAVCNAKGRTISTFIIMKQKTVFQLILTSDLIDAVRKKLQMYILRSDVQLTDQTEQLVLMGMHNITPAHQENYYTYPAQKNSYFIICTCEQAQTTWENLLTEFSALAISTDTWIELDILAGIPWLFPVTSEEFVPQMLNLDKLNAISFTKGCYTGQEIVARTHYLGKNKRAMHLAYCVTQHPIFPGCSINTPENPNNLLGTVILSAPSSKSTLLLVVLKDKACEIKNLQLNNENHDKIFFN